MWNYRESDRAVGWSRRSCPRLDGYQLTNFSLRRAFLGLARLQTSAPGAGQIFIWMERLLNSQCGAADER